MIDTVFFKIAEMNYNQLKKFVIFVVDYGKSKILVESVELGSSVRSND